MVSTCTKCQRANPAEATYCYFDGQLLPGHKQEAGPLKAGTRPFPSEFVFPSGRRCRNFDELALGCLQEWSSAVQLLHNGHLEAFFAGIGRADLAVGARQIARFPDPDRALDMLIERLPTEVVDPPRLKVEPSFVNLGQVKIGDSRRFELQISNQGMRLLYGSIAVQKAGWLALGDEQGVPEKSFQCDHQLTIPVQIRGRQLKASKGLEGKIQIESNGGSAEVVVKVEVPVKPFPTGILAGARKQRELAEKAFKNAREAAPLFENGGVARWYADNGWAYPVQGPPARGLAALQQFLEACGLTRPPPVEIDTAAVKLTGSPGDRLEHVIRVKALEKKPVYAYATSDQPWLTPRPAILQGTEATLPIEVPSVPFAEDGGALSAKLTVVSNGRRKFVVPFTLQIASTLRFDEPTRTFRFEESAAAPSASPFNFGEPPTSLQFEEPPDALPVTAGEPLELLEEARPVGETSRPQRIEEEETPAPAPSRRQQPSDWAHLTPFALLLLALAVLLLLDWHQPPPTGSAAPIDDARPAAPLADLTPYLQVDFSDVSLHRFGISLPRNKGKSLTYDAVNQKGKTNNTCIRVEGEELLFGREPVVPGPGHTGDPRKPVPYQFQLPSERTGRGWRSVLDYKDQGIRVTQDVSIRQSEPSGRPDTCLVRYTIEHLATKQEPIKVGLRCLIDTWIGSNDVPAFTIPGEAHLCDTMREFTGDEIPDFIEALEHPDLTDPGIVAHMTLKLDNFEPPSRVQIGAWPNHNNKQLMKRGARAGETLWDVPLASIKDVKPPDSAVVIYWEEKELKPGQKRDLAYAYGLGTLASAGEAKGKLALTLGGSFRAGSEFTVTAYAGNPTPGQKLTLQLPKGLELADAGAPERPVPQITGASYGQVSWRVKALKAGKYTLTVQSGDRLSQTQEVTVRSRSIFD